MAVSSNILTHFTSSIDYLEDILKNGFVPRLCEEDYSFLGKDYHNVLIPMVCFCDIPLHLIHEHISDYGSYGLGLSKSWGKKNGLNPLIYLDKETLLSKPFGEIFNILPDLRDPSVERNQIILENFWKIYCFLKPYQGIDKKGNDKIFYDENEWRYIPKSLHNIKSDGDIIGLTLFFDEATDDKKNEIQSILNKDPLTFDPENIRYIFIDKDKEREKTINMIGGIKSPKYSSTQIAILCSKIISYSQFEKDV
jgi:hypothetical protein